MLIASISNALKVTLPNVSQAESSNVRSKACPCSSSAEALCRGLWPREAPEAGDPGKPFRWTVEGGLHRSPFDSLTSIE